MQIDVARADRLFTLTLVAIFIPGESRISHTNLVSQYASIDHTYVRVSRELRAIIVRRVKLSICTLMISTYLLRSRSNKLAPSAQNLRVVRVRQ